MHVSTEDLRDGLAEAFIQIGMTARQAARTTAAIITVADRAAEAAITTLDGLMPDMGSNSMPARHTALQVLVARLTSVIEALEADLYAEGAVGHDVQFGVDAHG